MIEDSITLRPRYAETDQMGMVYYGRFAEYFEVARTECIRNIGIAYSKLEAEHNILLPVRELHIAYKKPARYDDELTIRTFIREFPKIRIRFEHEICNQKNELLTEGFVELVFVNKQTGRPCRPPEFFVELLRKKWK